MRLECLLGPDEFEHFLLLVGDVVVRGGALQFVQLIPSLQVRRYVLGDDAGVGTGGQEEGEEVAEVEQEEECRHEERVLLVCNRQGTLRTRA